MRTITKSILLLSAMAVTLQSAAQSTTLPQASFFMAEGSLYFEDAGCKPAGPVEFCSQVNGGKVLYTSIANADGVVKIKLTSQDKRPAFALNIVEARTDKTSETGHVSFYQKQEFSFDKPAIAVNNYQATLNWEGSTGLNDVISFEIQKNTGTGTWNTVAVIPVTSFNDIPYSWTDDAMALPGDSYRINVVNSVSGLRYSSSVLKSDAVSLATVYPTVTNGSVNIFVALSVSPVPYCIVNMQGQVVIQHDFIQGNNNMDLSSLPSGNYLLRIISKGQTQVTRIVKE